MHYSTLAIWSRQQSFVHSLDTRAKLVLLVAFLISLATLRTFSLREFIGSFALLLIVSLLARLPVVKIIQRALVVLPFLGTFGFVLWLSGEPQRAMILLSKGYLSGLAVILLVATSPLPAILRAARFFKMPDLLVEIIQILYRYLFVLSDQVQRARIAAQSRGGLRKSLGFTAASGLIAVLFSRSYEKAIRVQQAMLARGRGDFFIASEPSAFQLRDFTALLFGLLVILSLRFLSYGPAH